MALSTLLDVRDRWPRVPQKVDELLFQLLLEILDRHQPEIAPVLRGAAEASHLAPGILARVLQAQGIWFQLLSIAEQHSDMQRRRKKETADGEASVPGTFAHMFAESRQTGVTADAAVEKLKCLSVRPVITAHPTEAKRVTVLEKHRRIYRLLVEIEQTRYTPRERDALIDELGDVIELLWTTGELRLEKPTVAQEVAWGLYFFQENLYDAVPGLLLKFERALSQAYPGAQIVSQPFLKFGSWIGGDRDGNPFVTNEVTNQTVLEGALSALRYYVRRVVRLRQDLSIAEAALPNHAGFRRSLAAALDASKLGQEFAKRNAG